MVTRGPDPMSHKVRMVGGMGIYYYECSCGAVSPTHSIVCANGNDAAVGAFLAAHRGA